MYKTFRKKEELKIGLPKEKYNISAYLLKFSVM